MQEEKISSVFLICGNTATGKSTYSEALAKEKNAIHFCLDDWIKNLYYLDYNPNIHDFSWAMERVERCKTQMRVVAEPLIKKDINLVLEFGYGDVQSRKDCHDWARSLVAEVVVHYVDAPLEVRRERFKERNAEKGSTFTIEVTEEMFDFVEPLFVVPSENENLNIVRIENDSF